MTDDLEATLRQRAADQLDRWHSHYIPVYQYGIITETVLDGTLLRELVAVVKAARRARHYCPASHLPHPSSPGPDPCDLCDALAALDAKLSPEHKETDR